MTHQTPAYKNTTQFFHEPPRARASFKPPETRRRRTGPALRAAVRLGSLLQLLTSLGLGPSQAHRTETEGLTSEREPRSPTHGRALDEPEPSGSLHGEERRLSLGWGEEVLPLESERT